MYKKGRLYPIINLFYHLTRPIVDLRLAFIAIINYIGYIKDLQQFKELTRNLRIPLQDLNPQLFDKTPLTPIDHHYFYQQLWAFKDILKIQPPAHLDLGSTVAFSGYLAQIIPTTFADIRPPNVHIENLKILKADLLNLPLGNESQESISCLHVIEHIGLGRYGDALNPSGSQEACKEIARTLKKGGRLYLSVPIGRERICFNAHRVFNPKTIVEYFPDLKLIEFSVVDDNGMLHENTNWQDFQLQDYGCGLFLFEKPQISKPPRFP